MKGVSFKKKEKVSPVQAENTYKEPVTVTESNIAKQKTEKTDSGQEG